MDYTPLYIICFEQGIPMPNTTYDFVVSVDELQTFEVAKVKIGTSEARVKDAFVLGVTEDNSLSMSLVSRIDELHEAVAPIGLFCELLSIKEGSPTDRIVKCKVLCRALIEGIHYKDKKSYAEVALLADKGPPIEDGIAKEFKLIIDSLVKNNKALRKTTKTKIISSDNLSYIANLVVSELAKKESERYDYIQSKDSFFNFVYAMKILLTSAGKKEKLDELDFDSLFDSSFLQNSKSAETQASTLPERIRLAKIPSKSKSKIYSETSRLEKLPSGSLEYQALHEYLSWIADLPWGRYTNHPPDLSRLIGILDQTHYGLNDIKEHILEYLTIQKITGNPQGTVLCFVGEPGTGKTSIAKQIAKACNREIIKIALGGMSDESELRGHRRTYVASRPGRLAAGIKACGAMDPLILLDEIDKIDTRRGDPTSALLEILDPEQNTEFIDRYIEVPLDISSALFIATANYLEGIPAPLKDRMEIITFRNYTTEEKKVILTDFLLPSAKKDYGLEEMDISITNEATGMLISKEGIRNTKRRLLKILRKAAVKIVVQKQKKVLIDKEFLDSIKASESEKIKIGF